MDFLVVKDLEPYALFEAKESRVEPARSGSYFQNRLQIPYFQVVEQFDGVEAWADNRYTVGAARFLSLIG